MVSHLLSAFLSGRGLVAGYYTGNEAGEEGLAGEVGIVLLEVLLRGSDELDGGELEAAVLEAGDDGTDQAALGGVLVLGMDAERSSFERSSATTYLDAVRLDGNEAVNQIISIFLLYFLHSSPWRLMSAR